MFLWGGMPGEGKFEEGILYDSTEGRQVDTVKLWKMSLTEKFSEPVAEGGAGDENYSVDFLTGVCYDLQVG